MILAVSGRILFKGSVWHYTLCMCFYVLKVLLSFLDCPGYFLTAYLVKYTSFVMTLLQAGVKNHISVFVVVVVLFFLTFFLLIAFYLNR